MADRGYIPPLFGAIRLSRPLFSQATHTPFVKAKSLLRARGYPLDASERLIDSVYDRRRYAALQGSVNAYLTIPSTSNRNPLPILFAHRLQRDFGGVIVADCARALAQSESKAKIRWLEKLKDSVRYELRRDLHVELRGFNVVMVDDILTTGESLCAMPAALAGQGIGTVQQAILAAKKGGHPASPPNYDALARSLAHGLGMNATEIEREIQIAFPFVFANFLLSALKDAAENPAEVYAAIRRHAGLVRKAKGDEESAE